MSKYFSLFVLLVLLVSCSSTNKIEPQRNFDYTQEDIRENSLKEIDESLSENLEKALWKICLLKNVVVQNDIDYERVMNEYDEILLLVDNKIDEAFTNKDYYSVLRLYTSLQNLDIQSTKTEEYNAALKEFQKIQNKELVQEDTKKISSFLNGTVTIWIDKGYKIEGGVGYADRIIGSGFFIDPKGYLVTNYHVIESEVDPAYEGYSELYVKLASDSETKIPAKVVGYDKGLDLALVKVEIDSPFVFNLGTSVDLEIGDKIYAIGSPVGLDRTITSGIISADKRQVFSIGTVLQLDAAINSGNSGGPIINDKGIVQGIAFAGIQSYQGLNFAIPVEYLKIILPQLYNGNAVKHVWTGFYGKTIKHYPNDESGYGVELLYVMAGGNANIGGLQEKDVILSVNNYDVTCIEELQNVYLSLYDKTIYKVKILRDEQTLELPILFEERPKYPGKEMYERELLGTSFLPLFGMKLTNSSTHDKKKFFVDYVVKGSLADENGFSEFDSITVVRDSLDEKTGVLYTEIQTKKSKKGYLDINLVLATSLDSPNFF